MIHLEMQNKHLVNEQIRNGKSNNIENLREIYKNNFNK